MCFNIQNLSRGISDCHNLISATIKDKVFIQQHQTITFRSYRNFDIDLFNTDIVKIPEVESDQVHDTYKQYENEFSIIVDNHAPIKTRSSVKNLLPCMNSDLRKAFYHKHMVYTQYTKKQNSKTWGKCSKQRNWVTKLKKKKSMKTCFLGWSKK